MSSSGCSVKAEWPLFMQPVIGNLGSLHAIKRLHLDDAVVRERLLREGRLQSTLQHPNITRVTDIIRIDDSPALVMEYVDGPNLAELLAAAPLDLSTCR